MRTLISLGFRCDVAFQLRMHGGDSTSHFFDWLVTPPDAVVEILDRRFDVFHPDHLVRASLDGGEHIVDRMTGTVFFHQFPVRERVIAAPHLLFYPAFAEKFAYLARRFIRTVQERPVTLVRSAVTEAEARRIEQSFFRMFPSADAQFLYVTAEPDGWRTDAGHAVTMPPTDKSLGDPAEWAGMLTAEGLVAAPYRLSTADILGHDADDHNLSPDNRLTAAELRVAIAANPESVGFRSELARLAVAQHDLTAALEHWQAAAALEPAEDQWRIEAALTQWRLGQKSAVDAAAAIGRSVPRRLCQAHDLVRLLVAARQFGRARLAAVALLRDRPFDAELSFLKAQTSARQGRMYEAEYAADHAVALRPTDWRYHVLRAEVLAGTKRLAAAVEACETARRLDDNEATRAAESQLRRRALARV